MRHIVRFIRGVAHVLLPGICGIGIARYVAPQVIGWAMVALLLVLTYIMGANFDWPWRRSR